MARYFAFNSLARANRNSSAVVESTTAGRFDSTYVANAISVTNGSATTPDYAEVIAPFADGSSSASTIWLRFDLYATNVGASVECLKFMSGSTNAYRILDTTANTVKFQYWNTGTLAWVDWGTTFTVPDNTLNPIVIKLVCGSSFEVYVAGSLVMSSSTTPTNPVASIDRIRFCNWNSTGNAFYSQIMGANYDIRDAKFMAATLNGNSAANTDGTGAYTDVNETVLSDSTAILLATVGHKKGQTKAALTVPSGYSIASAVVNARGRVSGGTVTDGKLGLRSGGTNYSSTGRAYGAGYEGRSAMWATDPNGGAVWTQTSFNNAEPFIEAA